MSMKLRSALIVRCRAQRASIEVVCAMLAVVAGGCAAAPKPIAYPDLVVDGMPPLACGGIASMSTLSAPSGAENDNTPEAAELRVLIKTGIAGGEYQPPATNWTVLARTADTVTFGHREGPIGIGDTITVQRKGAGYTFAGSGGCGPVGYRDGRQAQNIDSYQVVKGGLEIQWLGGECLGETSPPSRPTLKAIETPTTVAVLLVPALGKPLPAGTFCAGVGRIMHATVALQAPLGRRSVSDAGYVPRHPLSPGRPIK